MIQRIGIVGGGQLGKMLTIAAKKMGFFVAVTDPTPQSPAGQVADVQIVADYKDPRAIRKLAKISDILTFEIELAGDKTLDKLLSNGVKVHPSPKTLSIIRDKLLQKKFLKKNGIPTANFLEISRVDDIEFAIKIFGYPFLIKARIDAYDGRGNALIKRRSDIKKALDKLKGRDLYAEKFVPFDKELAVMIARTPSGKVVSYPVVETRHRNNICDTVIAPARISKMARASAQKIAIKTISKLQGAGVFGIEMFKTKDDHILVNEIAPRVHNSGHYTIEGCLTSQFEQHIRAICDLPLGSPEMISKVSVMKNILGTKNGDGTPLGIEKVLKIPGVSLHMYGKREARPMRKMGHITVVGNSVDECLYRVNKARRLIKI